MKQLQKLLTILMLSAMSLTAIAQVKTGKILGTVKTGQDKTVAGATISLLKSTDSSVVKVVTAASDGKYDFQDIAPGKYLILVTAAGHVKTFHPSLNLPEQHLIFH